LKKSPSPTRKLNRRVASLLFASLVSLDSFASLHPPQAALGSLTPPSKTLLSYIKYKFFDKL
jgi:hypothetical protein